LHRRQKQSNQAADDGDDNQELNERKAAPLGNWYGPNHGSTSVV
jgi:hypothetical protein